MSEAERLEFLDAQRVVVCSTLGPRGWPHSMPLWYVVREGELWAWTYAKSQKARNLERDARATLLVEAGEAYGELRGVQIEARAKLVRALEPVVEFAKLLTQRYSEGIASVEGEAEEGLRAQAPKRVALRFEPLRTVSWDHRKLGGTY